MTTITELARLAAITPAEAHELQRIVDHRTKYPQAYTDWEKDLLARAVGVLLAAADPQTILGLVREKDAERAEFKEYMKQWRLQGDTLASVNAEYLARAEKAEAERDEARAGKAKLYEQLSASIRNHEKTEAERDEVANELSGFKLALDVEESNLALAQAEASDLKAQVALLVEALVKHKDYNSYDYGLICRYCEHDGIGPNAHSPTCVLASLPAVARAYSEERGRLVARVKELEGTAATEYAARGSHPETALEKELGDEFARIAKQGPTEGMISRSAYAAVELVKKHIGVRTPGTVEVCEMCETTGPSKCTGDLTCTLKDCPILAAAAESGEK